MQTQQIKMIILNQVQVNLIYNTNRNLFLPMHRNFHFDNEPLQYNC